MAFKPKKIIPVLLSAILFITGNTVFIPQTVNAASVKSYALTPGKQKEIQLDGKGAKEKIMYTFEDEGTGETNEYDEEYYKHTLALTINGDVVFEESVTKLYNPETKGDVYVTDIDKSDNVMDIFVAMYDKEYVSKYDVLYYCQYRDGEFVKVQDLKKYMYSGVLDCFGKSDMGNCHVWYGGLSKSISTSGDKKLNVIVCGFTDISDADWGGYFHGNFTLKLKNGKLQKAYKYPEGNIIQCDFDGGLSTKCTFYNKPGSSKKAFTAKKGETVKISGYRYIKNKLYIKAINKNKAEGWISGKKIFKNTGTLHA